MQQLTEQETQQILGKQKVVPPLYYKFGDYKYNTESKPRILSGIPDLDYMIKGFELGCMTIWTGMTNSGKTTMLTKIANQSIQQGERVFYFNGEQTKDDFKNNLYRQSTTKKHITQKQYKDSCVFDYFVDEEEAQRLDKIYGNTLFVYNNNAPRTIDFLLQAMEEIRQREKIKVYILDNFMQIETKTSDEYREQKEIAEKLRTFAVNRNVHIHLVVHSKKPEKFQSRLTLYDVFGSSNIVNKAYNVISIMRVDTMNRDNPEYERLRKDMEAEQYNIEETGSVLEVLKTKGMRCGLVGLTYDSDTKDFRPQHKMYETSFVPQQSRYLLETSDDDIDQMELPF